MYAISCNEAGNTVMKRRWVIAGAICVCTGISSYVITKKKQREARKQNKHVPYGPYETCFKRLLDVILSGMALMVLGPVMLLTAFLVRVKLGKPVLFLQERLGLDERVFRIFKFRTMTNEHDENGELLSDEQRLTKFGIILRSTSLDELPELFNIIRGDMSLVGPRPLLVKYLERYTPQQRRRQEVRPGLTGLAMAAVRNSAGWEKKFELDAEYVDKVSFVMDFKIVIRTIKIVLKQKGINEPGSVTNSEFMGTKG